MWEFAYLYYLTIAHPRLNYHLLIRDPLHLAFFSTRASPFESCVKQKPFPNFWFFISLQILISSNILFQTRAPALSHPHINEVTPSAITIPSHCTGPWMKHSAHRPFPHQSFVPSEPSSLNVFYNLLKLFLFLYTIWWSHNKGETFIC